MGVSKKKSLQIERDRLKSELVKADAAMKEAGGDWPGRVQYHNYTAIIWILFGLLGLTLLLGATQSWNPQTILVIYSILFFLNVVVVAKRGKIEFGPQNKEFLEACENFNTISMSLMKIEMELNPPHPTPTRPYRTRSSSYSSSRKNKTKAPSRRYSDDTDVGDSGSGLGDTFGGDDDG